jgi:rubrerythrin
MNITTLAPIEDVAEFLAHAELLEQESVERYEEMADCMETHNNPEVASLFRKLAHFGENHVREVEQRAAGMALPKIAPWDFKWSTPESPEAGSFEDAHYLMDRGQALQMALYNEELGRQFYLQVAKTTPDEEVKQIAMEFAEEEAEHVNLLKNWIANLDTPDQPPLEDLDPPNIPE